MRAPTGRLLLASLLILGLSPLPASAQFGFPGLPGGGRGGLPLPLPGPGLPGPGRVLGPGVFPILPFGRVHRTFGIIGAVAVGAIILGRMSRRDGVEVTRRTKVVLDRDRDREVVETYQTRDGGNRVTITAAPVQRISDIKDDPVLKQTADTAKQAGAGEKQASKGKKETTSPRRRVRQGGSVAAGCAMPQGHDRAGEQERQERRKAAFRQQELQHVDPVPDLGRGVEACLDLASSSPELEAASSTRRTPAAA